MLYLIVIITIIIGALLFKSITFKTPNIKNGNIEYKIKSDSDSAVNNLSKAVKIKTVSNGNYELNYEPFDEFIEFLNNTYTNVYKTMEFKRINNYGLVYKWTGSCKNKKPLLFLGHYDVVPVETDTENNWKYGPFSGEIAENKIWGRGSLDIKSQIIAHMEVADKLIRKGYIPERDIYYAFGNDEEVGGKTGAAKISEYFEQQGLTFEAVYDECGFVAVGSIKGVNSPVAQIGIAEKDMQILKLLPSVLADMLPCLLKILH